MPCRVPYVCLGEVCELLAKCDAQTPCVPGLICVENECLPSEAMLTKQIGPSGGILRGPDGVQLIVRDGAVSGDVQFAIGRAPAPSFGGITELSLAYQIEPASQVFDRACEVRIPTNEVGQDVHLYHAASETGPWTSLIGLADGAIVNGETRRLGYFVVAKP